MSLRTTVIRKLSSAAAQSPSTGLVKTYNDIPGPRAWPVIGSILSLKPFGGQFQMIPHDQFLVSLNQTYGDMAKFSILNSKHVYLFSTDLVRTLLKFEGANPVRPSVLPWTIYFKSRGYEEGILNSQGEKWRKLRKTTNPHLLRAEAVLRFLPAHNLIIDNFVARIKSKFSSNELVVDKFNQELNLAILDMICLLMFNRRFESSDSLEGQIKMQQFIKSIEEYGLQTMNLMYSLPLWVYFKNPNWSAFENSADVLMNFTRKYVVDSLNSQTACDSSLVQSLLQDERVNMEEIVSLITDLLIGSFDTTSTSLHHLLYILSANPTLQEELYQEIRSVFPEDGVVNEQSLSKIPLLRAIVKETHRFYSIASSTTRSMDKEIVLDGYHIPKDTFIHIGLDVMSKSERYFTNAKQFNPKRWLNSDQHNLVTDPFASIPFGHGIRNCVGRRLAEQKIYVVIIKLIKNFRFEYLGESEYKTKHRLIAVPVDDLKVKLIRR